MTVCKPLTTTVSLGFTHAVKKNIFLNNWITMNAKDKNLRKNIEFMIKVSKSSFLAAIDCQPPTPWTTQSSRKSVPAELNWAEI